MIPDPWDVPKIKKIGLVDMYITRALMQTLGVSCMLSLDAPHKMNPMYAKIKKHLDAFLDEPTQANFLALCDFLVEKELICLDKIGLWEGYLPDIRVVDTAEECLSCLATRCLKLKPAGEVLKVPPRDKDK